MKLSEEVKQKIREEYDEWVKVQYGSRDRKDRQNMGQFFTPPDITFEMIEKFDDLNGKILDPTVGCGGLLAACIIAGADPKKCYGIELDEEILKICKNRLKKLGVPDENIKLGDALKSESYNFN